MSINYQQLAGTLKPLYDRITSLRTLLYQTRGRDGSIYFDYFYKGPFPNQHHNPDWAPHKTVPEHLHSQPIASEEREPLLEVLEELLVGLKTSCGELERLVESLKIEQASS
jgi:hypothetical protein